MRAAAFGVDLLLLAGVPLVATTGFVFSLLLALPDPPAFLSALFRASQVLFVLLFLCRDAAGLSPGKSLFGLRVVRVDGQAVTLLDSLARNLPLAVPGWNLIEAFAVLRRPDARRPGDLAAGTKVVEA